VRAFLYSVWSAAIVVLTLSPQSAEAQRTTNRQAAGAEGPASIVRNACARVVSEKDLATCVWRVVRFDKTPAAYTSQLLTLMLGDLVSYGSTGCRQYLSATERTLQAISKRFKITIEGVPTDCAAVERLYEAFTGVPAVWLECPPAEYSYEHLRACLRGAYLRQGLEKAVRRFFENALEDSKQHMPLPVPNARTLDEALARVRANPHLNNLKAEVETSCVNADISPQSTSQLYARLVQARSASPDPQMTEFFKIAKAVTCRDVVRLAIELGVIGADQLARYENTASRRDKERAEARAARCNPQRANAEPNPADIKAALNTFLLDHCDKPTAWLMQAGKPEFDPILHAASTIKREGPWCTISILTVTYRLNWSDASARLHSNSPRPL